jgi:hypothetical protein
MTDIFRGPMPIEYEQTLVTRIRDKIASATFETADDEALNNAIAEFTGFFTIEPPKIVGSTEALQPSSQIERTVQNDGRYSRLGIGYTEKIIDFTFIVPIEGDGSLLRLTPNTAPFGTGIKGDLSLSRDEIKYTYSAQSAYVTEQQLAQEISNDLKALRRHIEAIEGWANHWNAQLEARVRPLVVQRCAELQKNSTLGRNLRVSF